MQSKASRAGWELWKQVSHGPAPSPLRSSKAFLLSSHGSTCKMVATIPNLEANELPRPRKQFLGGTAHLFCICLQFQCTCISGWPGLNSSQKREGRGRGRLGTHAMPKSWVPTWVCHAYFPAHPLHDPCQLQIPFPLTHPRTGTIRTETRSDFNSVLRDLGPDPEIGRAHV